MLHRPTLKKKNKKWRSTPNQRRAPAHNVVHARIHACAAEVEPHGLGAIIAAVAPPLDGVHACSGARQKAG